MARNRVLFCSDRPLLRAENVKAVYRGYTGPKQFCELDKRTKRLSAMADVLLTDEFRDFDERCSVMVTHGIPLTKKYGLDQKNAWFNAEGVDYVIAPSKDAVAIMAKQAGISERRVLPLGMPRTDNYIGKRKGDGGTSFADKKVYLYVPTFRNMRLGEGKLPPVDWEYVDSQLSDDEVLIYKCHMRTGKGNIEKPYKHIVEIDNYVPSTPYLIDCDILITDYSSILFDGHILNKPIVLFAKDSERYLEERGLYFDYPYGYASNYCRSEDELIHLCRNAKRNQIDENCKEVATGACDGHSVERITELITLL